MIIQDIFNKSVLVNSQLVACITRNIWTGSNSEFYWRSLLTEIASEAQIEAFKPLMDL